MEYAYPARGCDRFSSGSDLAYLGYSREVVCGQAGRTDRICDSLWRMGQLRTDDDKIGDLWCNRGLCSSTCGVCWKRIDVTTICGSRSFRRFSRQNFAIGGSYV